MFGLCVTINVFFPFSGGIAAIFLNASARRSFSMGVTTRPPSVISREDITSLALISLPVSTARLNLLV